MPRYTSSQTFTEGNTQIVALPEAPTEKDKLKTGDPEEEDLEIKLQRITELVPLRVQNTSGSSAGSGSGDFHQYRSMRRREQDRLARMEVDWKKRTEEREFNKRREERLKLAEDTTAKKRAKRQRKKENKKAKTVEGRSGPESDADGKVEDVDSDEGEDGDGVPTTALD